MASEDAGNPSAIVGFIAFVIFGLALYTAFNLFLFYTLSQILPTLAVVQDHDSPAYAALPLTDVDCDASPPAYSEDSLDAKPKSSPFSSSIFSLLAQLRSTRSHFKFLAFVRGFRLFSVISFLEATTSFIAIDFFRSSLGLPLSILLQLLFVQLYALWTHTIIIHRSHKSFWQRLPPFWPTLRATGPALAAYLASKALLRFTLFKVIEVTSSTGQYAYLSLVLVSLFVQLCLVVPCHLVLTRIQVSLLPMDEIPILPIDEALRNWKLGDKPVVGVTEALLTFRRSAWKNLAWLSLQIFAVAVVGGAAVVLVTIPFAMMYLGIAFVSKGV